MSSGNKLLYIKIIWSISYNVHNILELFKVFVQVPFTTSEAELDIKYKKRVRVLVASEVAEEKGNFRRISKLRPYTV